MCALRIFITGVTGQDGSYLAEAHLDRGNEVWGLVRRSSSRSPRLETIQGHGSFHVVIGDLTDPECLALALHKICPDRVYNLAAQSHVALSFKCPIYTMEANAVGAMRLLEICRHLDPMPRFYQAGTSEQFGNAPSPQSEKTPFNPRSPYAVSKLAAFHAVKNYREAYGMFACSGMLFNHESRRRGHNFVTQKIARAAANIKLGHQDKIELGNLEARRDWGYALDYVRAMIRMLGAETPRDYVVGTGVTHSVREFAETAFRVLCLDFNDYFVHSPQFDRPADVAELRADPSAIYRDLGWRASRKFEDLVKDMVFAMGDNDAGL